MKRDPANPKRRSIRLKGYDYTSPGAYFVTICVQGRECVLGDVVDGEMRLSGLGQTVHGFWSQVPIHFPSVSVDAFVVMPNHVHATIMISDPRDRGGTTPPLQQTRYHCRGAVIAPSPPQSRTTRPTLGQIVAYYKYQTTKKINQIRDSTPFWQRGFYDRIIRNDRDLDVIRHYIVDNPLKWELDRDHPENIGTAQIR